MPENAPRIAPPANPFARPIVSFEREIKDLAWEFPFLAQVVQLAAILAATLICVLLYLTVGVSAQLGQSLRRLIDDCHRQRKLVSPTERVSLGTTTLVYYLLLVPALLVQLPFLLLGWLWARLGFLATLLLLAAMTLPPMKMLYGRLFLAGGGAATSVDRASLHGAAIGPLASATPPALIARDVAAAKASASLSPGGRENGEGQKSPVHAILPPTRLIPAPLPPGETAPMRLPPSFHNNAGLHGHNLLASAVLARTTGGSHGPEAGQTAARAGRAGAMVSVPGRAPAPRAEQPSAPLGYWPRFHGPHADNISSDVGLLKRWPPQGPRLLWTALGIGEGYSSVTLAKGLIYTAGNVGEATAVTALDGDGRIVWQVEAGKAWTESYPGTRSTPTIDGDRLYFESPLGDLVCLDCRTGKRLWGLNILDQFAAHNIIWALAESPLVDGDRVICCPCGQKASVAALDKNSGRTIWAAASTGEPAGYASPVVVEHQGLRIILAMTGRSLLGVSAADGAILWQFAHATQYDINALTPIYHDGQIFISSGYRVGSELLKIHWEGGKFSVAKLWQCPTLDNQHGGVLLVGGRFYGASHASSSGKWICVDGKSGAVLAAAAGLGPATFTCAERLFYAMNEHGKVGLVAPTPKGFQVLSEFQLPHRGEGPTWAHPVVCGGRLYLRHGNLLFAYDVRAPR